MLNKNQIETKLKLARERWTMQLKELDGTGQEIENLEFLLKQIK